MKLASLFVEVAANVNSFERGMKNVRSEIDQTSKHASLFSNALSNAIGYGVANAATKAISGLNNLVKSVVGTGIEFNNLEQNATLAFETMIGSGEKAKVFLNDLKNFAKTTPFELPGLIESSQRLLAFGFDAQKVIPMMTSIGDAVAGLGGSPEKLNRVILAFGQIKAKGKVMAGEMLQLTEAGIPAWEMLAKKIGVSIPEAMKMGERGMINADTAITAILEGMNSKFGGLMGKQSKSWSGMLSNIKDTFTQVTGRVMKPFFDLGLKGMEKLLKLFDSPVFETFVQKMTKGASFAANFIGKIGKGFIGLFTGDYKSFFGGLFKGFEKLQKIVGKYENKRFGWLSNFTPKEALTSIMGFIDQIRFGGKYLDYWLGHMPKLLQPIARLVIGLDLLKQIMFGFKERMPVEERFKNLGKISEFLLRTVWGVKEFTASIIDSGFASIETAESISILPKILQPVAKAVDKYGRQIFGYLTGVGLQATIKKLGSVLVGLGSILSKLVRPFKDALGGLFTQLSTMKNLGFADIFKTILSSIAQAFTGFLKVIREEFWPTIKGALVWVWDSLTAFITSINWSSVWEAVTGVFIGLYQFVQSIDWGSIGTAVVSVFNTIVDYVASLNWDALWTTIWSGLSAINSILKDTVFPALGSFFEWLLSWFLDDTKRQALSNAINKTWLFVADWASYIWQGVSPYLSSFFSWLLSWFTDQSKRSQLWNAVSTTWDFVTQWSINLWTWASPGLSSFFNYLLSWVTDPTKRGRLWSGIATAWNWITQWGMNLATWLAPYLSNFWQWLTSWIVDPTKRQSMYDSLVTSWNAITLWGSNLWGWLQPELSKMYVSLIGWLDSQKSGLGTSLDSWKQSFVSFAVATKNAFNENLPQLSKATSEASTSISKDIGSMIYAFQQLFGVTKESGPNMVSDWAKIFTSIYTIVSRVTSGVVKAVSSMVQALAIMKTAIGGMTSGNFDFSGLTGQLNDLMQGMQGSIIEDIAKWIDPLYWIGLRPEAIQGHATGGITQGGSVLVGEKGPEVVDLPRGSRVWDHGQSMGKLADSGSNQTFTIILKNEGNLPTDRRVIDEIATQLQRRLAMQGNRLVFA